MSKERSNLFSVNHSRKILSQFFPEIADKLAQQDFNDSLHTTVKQVKSQENKLQQSVEEVLTKAKNRKLNIEINGTKISSLKGEKGDKGDRGEKGDKGDSITGPQGKQGIQGVKGERGEMGIQGLPGKNGKDGKSGKDAKQVPLQDILKEFSKILPPEKGKIDQRWHGGGLSRVSTDTTLTGLGTLSSPLSVVGGGFTGSQEKSTTVPNNVLQTFAFTHTPKIIFWNGMFQTLTDDYTVSGSSITFTGSNIPVTGDKIVNIYA